MNSKRNQNKVYLIFVLFLAVAIFIEASILNYSNKKQVAKTSLFLLDQVEIILDDNDKSEKATIDSLKEEYIQKADTVAYILSEKEECDGECEDELKKIAGLMGIDEICLFDENGVIYASTVPEYIGLSFDSGEQISFFKPMLTDKTLSMCQDVTENTALSKSMMYANVWNPTGAYIVQVGIEPVRLLNEVKNNSIHEVVSKMPTYDGVNIYVSDADSNEIIGSTDKQNVGKSLLELGIVSEKDDVHSITEKSVSIGGFTNYCFFREYGNYLITVVHSTKSNLNSFATAIAIEIAWLLVAGSIITYMLIRLFEANTKIHRQISMLSSISDIYYSMHLIDLSDYSIEKIEANALMDDIVESGTNAKDMVATVVETAIDETYKEDAYKFVDLDTLPERLKGKNIISMDAIDVNVGWLRISYISEETNDDGVPTKVIIATQIIDEDKKREEDLLTKANRDELTGLFNRRAYEDDILNYPTVPPEPNFVYVSIDINGLKVVNDTMGHMAGDELIEGAAQCMKEALGPYGKIYRTGGDEFVAMIFADEERLEFVLKDLEQVTSAWEGLLVDSLAMSVGCASKREFSIETVNELAKIAEERMYQAKTKYYSQKGVDRRGQAEAHKALCNLYTKILKINLTDDSFSIVNMDITEQTEEKGYSNSISEWLSGFGKTGQVHEEDLDNYLELTNLDFMREYFKGNKTSLSVFYRRKYGEQFKQVMMEMIPADDYENDNQSLFLYVKDIDK